MSARKSIDCRTIPNEIGCTLFMSGGEDEVLKEAVAHAVSVHGEADTPELQRLLRRSLQDEEVVFSRAVSVDDVGPAIH